MLVTAGAEDAAITPGVRERALGAMLGQAVGDALGTTVELETAAQIAARYPGGLREVVGGGPFRVRPGQVTDDTELALALARSLVARRGYEPDDVAAAYCRWYRSGPFDVGDTTRRAFSVEGTPGPGQAARLEARASATSQANGSLMRMSPLGVFGWRLPLDALVAAAMQDSRLSHPHALCQAACALFAHAIAFAVRTGASAPAVFEQAQRLARSRPDLAVASGVLDDAEDGPPPDYQTQMGWVRIAFQNAFYELLHASSFEEGVVRTVMAGGDTDTNACIAGALLGAVHGAAAIPAQWRAAVLACESPRPREYACNDLTELAEALLRG